MRGMKIGVIGLGYYQGMVDTAPLVVDFRGVTRGIAAHNVVRL
jgi:hypothetical protein